MSENWKLVASGLGGGLLVLSAMFGLDKTDIAPPADQPAAESPCPVGWQDASDTAQDTLVLACKRDGWLVILTPSGAFERAWKEGLADWTTDPEIAGWPK